MPDDPSSATLAFIMVSPTKLWAASAVLAAMALPSPAALTVAAKGKSSYRIVIASNAIPSERYAAEEFQRYLEKISGATLPIMTDAERGSAHEIMIGDNAHLRELGLN